MREQEHANGLSHPKVRKPIRAEKIIKAKVSKSKKRTTKRQFKKEMSWMEKRFLNRNRTNK